MAKMHNREGITLEQHLATLFALPGEGVAHFPAESASRMMWCVYLEEDLDETLDTGKILLE
jgi:hypothetical protein